ncbi:hypothetical protein M6B22_06040 [Jatrophihabitans cynanchi]|uniref:Uncharacterized protein n=1 Tax=Jatrophihabitans cynanchi TaxID=2944128 RepID=A0ABY7K0X9_9ACTN|nr:hypothetical protein [Jatrophihabitans sp. SB3-54]WAX58324.1 hypothetical protein M6B22_06040 [Jatrophihabitans sp. SB3-54]
MAIAIGDWYLTQLRGDVNVVRAVATPQEKSALSHFYRLLKDQRDYSAHPADYDRKVEAEAWREDVRQKRSQPLADGNLIDALVNELCTALDCLCVVAARIVNDPIDSQSWRETAALSPEEEVRAVYANLGRHLPEHRVKYVALQFSKHPDLARAKSRQQRANIGELVVLGVLATPLRVPYDEILDEFGFIGDSRASALLLIAHGVQASGVPEARLVSVLREAWDAVQRTGLST